MTIAGVATNSMMVSGLYESIKQLTAHDPASDSNAASLRLSFACCKRY